MRGLTVRQFRMEDTDGLLALWDKCGITRWEPNPRQTIQKKMSHSPDGFLVGLRDEELVASVLVGYDGLRGWMYRLAVAPSSRRQGIGRAMVDSAENWLRGLGCVRAKLQVEERAREAVGFYERVGYEVQQHVSMSRWLVPADA